MTVSQTIFTKLKLISDNIYLLENKLENLNADNFLDIQELIYLTEDNISELEQLMSRVDQFKNIFISLKSKYQIQVMSKIPSNKEEDISSPNDAYKEDEEIYNESDEEYEIITDDDQK